MSDVLNAYEVFVTDVDEQITKVQGDNFFASATFEAFNEELKIRTFTDVAKDDHLTPMGNKLGIVDRFTRTLKGLIKKVHVRKQDQEMGQWLGRYC